MLGGRQTPRGVQDLLPTEYRRREAVSAAIQAVFERWGYEPVATPAFECLDVLAAADGWVPEERIYTLYDRDGTALALRPEMTTPLCRVAGTRLRDVEGPLRLCYVADVFRYEEPQVGRRRQFRQAGVELFGAAGPEADAEVIALAAAAFEAAGVRGLFLDIGHVEFVRGLTEAGPGGTELSSALRSALCERDYVALTARVNESGLPDRHRRALLALPHLVGGREVLDEARSLVVAVHPNERSLSAIEELEQVLTALTPYGLDERVRLDLGLVKDIDYYSGMVLEGYAAEVGGLLCTGGRYDPLTARFGRARAATGFALGVERTLLALERQREGAGRTVPGAADGNKPLRLCVVSPDPAAWAFAVETAAAWRGKGLRVALDRPPAGAAARPASLQSGVEEDGPRVEVPAAGQLVWLRQAGAAPEPVEPEEVLRRAAG